MYLRQQPIHSARCRILAALTTLLTAAALSACGGGTCDVPSAPGTAAPPDVVLTPNDPATAGPPASAVTPPNAAPDDKPSARRFETVRCAP